MEDNSALLESLDMDMLDEAESFQNKEGMDDSSSLISLSKPSTRTGDDLVDSMLKEYEIKERKEYDPKAIDSECLKARNVFAKEILRWGHAFQMSPVTCHGAVSILSSSLPSNSLLTLLPQISMFDHLFGLYRYNPKHLQLLAMACFTLSSKYHETELHLPTLQEVFQHPVFRFNPVVFTKKDVHRWEISVLEWLNWKVERIVPVQFVETFLQSGIVFPGDKFKGRKVQHGHEYNGYVRKYAHYLSELCAQGMSRSIIGL